MTVALPGRNETDIKRVIRSLHEIGAGRSNATGTVTLATGAATTTVNDNNCSSGSTVILTPKTANAATEQGNGTMYVSAVANGSFTITHANSATTGRTFYYAFVG